MKPPLSHYSPKSLNKAWADKSGYISYFSSPFTGETEKEPKGWKQWGRQRGLYNWSVEKHLETELETPIRPIYEKLCSFKILDIDERMLWSQFLLSQLVRTPSFIRYEEIACEIHSIEKKLENDRVGCSDCFDLYSVANRDWCYLVAHEDDYFVRTDNPVFQTGFIELPESCLFYPLTPRLCFVACSMGEDWSAQDHNPAEIIGYKLEKGGAHFYNFYLTKAVSNTLIIPPGQDKEYIEVMYNEVLGLYPQPPFSLHAVSNLNHQAQAFESIRALMSIADEVEYAEWLPLEIAPFYQRRDNAA